MEVVIGIDPHKASHHAFAVNEREVELAQLSVRATRTQTQRLLAKRNTDIGDRRTQVVCRMHALLVELAPGGIAKEINASDVDGFLTRRSPASPVEQIRFDLAVELLAEIRSLDAQLKVSRKRIEIAVRASGTRSPTCSGSGRSSPRC